MAKKILIIEDEEILLDLLCRKLAKEGYRVLTAKNGEDGLRLAKEEKPDLILLDILMPKVSGMEVLREMAKDKAMRQIPVIIVSNSGQPVELYEAQKLGVRDWLIKTQFDPSEVINKVKRQIG